MSTNINSGLLLCPPEGKSDSYLSLMQEVKQLRDSKVLDAIHSVVGVLFYKSLRDIFTTMVVNRNDSSNLVKQLHSTANISSDEMDILQESIWSIAYHDVKRYMHGDENESKPLSASLVIFPDKPVDGKIPAMTYVPNEVNNVIFASSIVEEFRYWNNSDKPDDISEEDWDSRKTVWQNVFSDSYIPSQSGLIIELFDGNIPSYLNPYFPRLPHNSKTDGSNAFYDTLTKLINDHDEFVDTIAKQALSQIILQKEKINLPQDTSGGFHVVKLLRNIVKDIKEGKHETEVDEMRLAVRGMIGSNLSLNELRKTVFDHLLLFTSK